jgi:phosphoribosylformylglycinamidine cyclo-ligase
MADRNKKGLYADAGVDIDAGNEFVRIIKPILKKTFGPGVLTDIGGFAGAYSLKSRDIRNPVLVSSTDGVGTKLKIAFMMDKHDTVGIDLVAMCVNDIMVQGATPLFMLDYLAMDRLDLNKAQQIIRGIAQGCMEAGCSLIGGETAEMPGFYAKGEYDLAGFVVGIVENERLMDGSEISFGCKLIGVASSGLHSNGYSLVRKILFEQLKLSVENHIEELGRSLGEELLEPTKIYSRVIRNVLREFPILGMAHITGGGLVDNIPRILPRQCKAVVRKRSWIRHPIFHYLQKNANIPEEEMLRTFNCGIGLVMVVNEEHVDEILQRLEAMGELAFHIGDIESIKEDEKPVIFID